MRRITILPDTLLSSPFLFEIFGDFSLFRLVWPMMASWKGRGEERWDRIVKKKRRQNLFLRSKIGICFVLFFLPVLLHWSRYSGLRLFEHPCQKGANCSCNQSSLYRTHLLDKQEQTLFKDLHHLVDKLCLNSKKKRKNNSSLYLLACRLTPSVLKRSPLYYENFTL